MKIFEIIENKKKYVDLLLLANEQKSIADKYIDRVRMFVLDDGLKADCVVTEGATVF